ncbi:hypothetical protein [Mesobacterium pallidum]|uniref:hypothetical protein n=1 Tax=Mesobacterium pallidum TaxID=2872037 RepID=UPI002342C8BF|nr:hypothetical protein [Mesobacterium pallidum]
MAIHSTSLSFETSGQSLWSPGSAYSFSIDTGDSLIFSTSGATDVTFDLLGNGFTGEAYLDLQIGLFAYATLGTTGGLDATFDLEVNPVMPGGLLIETRNAEGQLVNAAPSGTFSLDFSDYRLVASTLETEGFSSSAAAGLDFVLGLEAGLRNAEYFYWGGGDTLPDLTLLDIDWTGDDAIPLITIEAAQPELELELNKYITISARMPTGADTDSQVTYGIGDAPTITASGASDTRFIELSVDLDELLVQFAGKLPGVGAVIKGLGETVFAEHEFDLADYVPLIPRDKLVVKATALDISANTGIVITEKSQLDFGGGTTDPRVQVTLVSDNGTPDFGADDQTEVIWLGEEATFLRPVHVQGATGASAVPDLGDITVSATYTLPEVTLDHDVGFGLNSVFEISALQAELTGGWVPSRLQVSFGPLLSLELPDGGFTFDLFSLDLDPFRLQDGAFNTISDEYEIFFTTELAPDQTTETDLEAENARQAIIDYRLERAANVAEAVSAFGDLIDGHTQFAIGPGADNLLQTVAGNANVFAVWDGFQDSLITRTRGAEDFYVVKPLTAQEDNGRIFVRIGTSGPESAGHGFDMSDHEVMLNALDSGSGLVSYGFTRGPLDENVLSSTQGVDVIGGNQGDLVLWFDNGGDTPVLLDGAGQGVVAGQYDRLLANFAAHHADVPILLDLVEMQVTGTGATVGPGTLDLTLRGIEALTLRTGDADDFIVGYLHPDFIDTGAGHDFVVLPGDNSNDTVALRAGDDVIQVEIIGGGGADLINGGTGYDQATLISDPAGQGLRVDVVVEGITASTGGDGFGVGSAVADLVTLSTQYMAGVVFGSLTSQLDRTGLSDTDHHADLVRYLLSDGSGGVSVVNLNSSLENISVIGSDVAGDAVLYTGGAYYEGGAGTLDTLIANFDYFEEMVGATGGVVLDGMGDDGSGLGMRYGSSFIRGFEKLVVEGTQHADNISGGIYSDYIRGGAGNDNLYGGDDAVGDQLIGDHGRDVFYWFDNGADMMTGGSLDAPESLDFRDMLIVGPGTGTTGGTTGGLAWAFLANLGALGGGGRSLRGGLGILDAGADLADILAGTALARESDDVTALGFGVTDIGDMLAFRGIETVNITATDAADDLVFFNGGAFYDAGESANDQDVFAADFSAQVQGIDLRLERDETTPIRLANGVTLAGMDRLVLTAGSGNDVIHGNWLDDYIDGGRGVDRLFGGEGDDILLGGAGNDVVYWMADGFDLADGGEDDDRLIITGATPEGTTRELGIWLNRGSGPEFRQTGADLSMLGLATLLQSLGLATTTEYTAGLLEGESLSKLIVLDYANFELVDVIGSDASSDLVVFDGGSLYWGGTGAATDLFVADFSTTAAALLIDAGFESSPVEFSQDDLANPGGTGFADTYDIGNGTYIGAFERFGLQMGSGADTVIGGALADYIDGGDGNDLLESGGNGTAERETILGGAGDDTLAWDGGAALLDGGAGTGDKVVWTAAPGAISLGIGDEFNVFATYGTADLASFSDMQQLVADLGFFPVSHYTFDGGGTNDLTITGAERMAARGSDSFTGDVLIAMEDRSQLFGLAGDDVLISGTGDDLLVGGQDYDRYVFFGSFGFDQVFGEKGGGGALYFLDLAFSDLFFSEFEGDLVIDTPGGTVFVADYWTHGGLDFTLFTTDFTGGTGVPTDTPGATPPSGNIVFGTDGDDTGLAGSFGNDTITGGAGNDELLGSPGADVFDGGRGVDVVNYAHLDESISVDLSVYRGFSGSSADKDSFANIEGIIAGRRAASIVGDGNDNFLAGSPEGDLLDGRDGEDMLVGEEGDDTIGGGRGNDLLFGDEGDDTLFGQRDDDYLSGGDGADSLEGEDGDDTLAGGRGNDTLRGGDGADVLFYGGEDTPGSTGLPADGLDTLDGGLGADLVDMTLLHVAIDVVLSKNAVFAYDGTVAGTGSGTLAATLIDVEEARGSALDDRLDGNLGDNYLDGYAGDDTFFGASGGTDTLFGDDGLDLVDYSGLPSKVAVVLDLSDPLPTVSGPGFTDHLVEIEQVIGSGDSDFIAGDGADNLFRGGQLNDTLLGRAGDDYLDGGAGLDQIAGGDGYDIYSVEDGASGVFIDMAMNLYEDGHGNAETPTGIEGIRGTSHDDTITGNTAGNMIMGGEGDDSIRGDGGADQLFGEGGNDTLVAGVPMSVLVKPESDQNDAFADAPLLNGLLSLDAQARRDAPLSTTQVPTVTIFGTTSGVVDRYRIDLMPSQVDTQVITVDIDATPPDFFTWIKIVDEAGTVHAEDRGLFVTDPGSTNNLDAQVTLTRPVNFAGVVTYYIEVHTWDFATDGPVTPDAGLTYTMHVSVDAPEQITPAPPPGEGSFLYGGDGDDELIGSFGADQLIGGADNDLLEGISGDDQLYGNDGIDILRGGAGNDLVIGGDGDDLLLSGGSGRDTVEGGLGNDFIEDHGDDGFAGSDLVKAGAGDDTYIGLGGDDTVDGGDGSDYILIDAGSGADLIDGGSQADTILSGDGNDTVAGGNGRDLVLLGSGDDLFTDEDQDGPFGGDTVQGNSGADTIIGLGGNDSFEGGFGFDEISGGNDDDMLHGNQGNDTVDGGAGNDLIFGGIGDDSLLGGSQGDTIEGGDGADTVDGGDGRDVVTLGAGNDLFRDTPQEGGNGADLVSGEDGNDTLLGDGGEDTLSGGADDDVIAGGAGNDLLSGDAGFDVIEGGAGNDTIDGGAQADTIIGDDNDDHVTGGFGADTVRLGAGQDVFVDSAQTGPNGADLVFGGSGNDLIQGNLGNDTYVGGNGLDTILGGSDNDSIVGGRGADSIEAGAGNDTVAGGNGTDLVDLGEGDDLFIDTAQQDPFGNDTVLGGEGADTILGEGGNDSLDGGAGADSITGGQGADTLRGGSQTDTIEAGDGADLVEGGLGLDVALLGRGADTWIDDAQSGPFGADEIDGGEGDDTIHLFGGDDTATGGEGADTFVLQSTIDHDRITDFELGLDTLMIDAGLWSGALTQARLDALTTSGPGSTLELTFDTGDTLVLDGLVSNAGLLDDIVLSPL